MPPWICALDVRVWDLRCTSSQATPRGRLADSVGVDTQNEDTIAQAIKASGKRREELFITSKLAPNEAGPLSVPAHAHHPQIWYGEIPRLLRSLCPSLLPPVNLVRN